MDFSWLENLLYGFFSGIADILPVSAQAHSLILLRLFGNGGVSSLLLLLIHLSTLAALYYCSQNHILRMVRARKLARIPRRRRRRPLDERSLMDLSLLKTMLIPMILGFLFFEKASTLGDKPLVVAGLLLLNGVILYVPQFFPSGNRDSRTLSRVEGFLVGLGGAASVLPGISAVGAGTSIASLCGIDRKYALNIVLIMNMGVSVGRIVFDVVSLVNTGMESLSFSVLLYYILAAGAAFCGVILAVKVLRTLANRIGYTCFAYYCWGAALFTFVLSLLT